MLENNQKQSEEVQEKEYSFYWNYEEQTRFDEDQRQKNRRKSIVTYAIVISLVFILCIGALFAAMMLDDRGPEIQYTGTSPAERVAMELSAQTVLITAQMDANVSYGTGFFIRKNGYIATNYHVVDGAQNITVTLYSGVSQKATLVGYSSTDDLAVLKISGNNYPVVSIGDSDDVMTGSTVIAVGHPLGAQYPWSVTQGIISFPQRTFTVTNEVAICDVLMMQFDAPVNIGNSGGALCNARGEVIGVISRKQTGYEGLGFAIPINGAIEILDAIVETGSADHIVSKVSRSRPLLGVSVSAIEKGDIYSLGGVEYTASHTGVIVVSLSNSGAAINKMKVGDIIISLDGKPVTDLDTMTEILYGCKPGKTVSYSISRNGEIIEDTITFPKGN